MSRYSYKLPDVGEGVAEAEIVAWHVKVGDHVEEDQALVEVMTDKATVEMTAPVSGTVVIRNGEPGEMVAVGSELAVLELEAGAAAPEEPAADGADDVVPDAAPRPAAAEAPAGAGRFVYKLPDVGEGVAEAEIVAWHVKAGDKVEEDQPLVEVMTDKATVEMTSPVSGVVLSIQGAPGEMAAVGSVLAELAVAGAAPADAPTPRTATAAEPVAPTSVARQTGARVLAAPAVRARAKALGFDLAEVAGTGPEGRVTHKDLDAAVGKGGKARPSGGGYARREGVEEVKVIGLRRKIAEKMQESKRRIPHFGYVEEVDVTELEDLRLHLNAAKSADRPKLTLLPFLMRALVRVLPDYPQINARYDDDAGVLHRYAPVHIGVATSTEGGLIVPVVRHAEALDVWASASEVARLAQAARDGSAKREELTGSTITITSLGTLGGFAALPVINHPETAIVCPNRMVERPVVRGGQVVVRKIMNLSSCYDHRVVDGYDGAAFIQRVKALLEHPATLFMD